MASDSESEVQQVTLNENNEATIRVVPQIDSDIAEFKRVLYTNRRFVECHNKEIRDLTKKYKDNADSRKRKLQELRIKLAKKMELEINGVFDKYREAIPCDTTGYTIFPVIRIVWNNKVIDRTSLQFFESYATKRPLDLSDLGDNE